MPKYATAFASSALVSARITAVFLPVVIGLGTGCTRSQPPAHDSLSTSSSSSDSVWVSKPDGGKLCSIGSGQTLETVAAELKTAKIQVLESRKKGDEAGADPSQCGMPAGTENAFRIQRKDLPAASGLGFHEVGK